LRDAVVSPACGAGPALDAAEAARRELELAEAELAMIKEELFVEQSIRVGRSTEEAWLAKVRKHAHRFADRFGNAPVMLSKQSETKRSPAAKAQREEGKLFSWTVYKRQYRCAALVGVVGYSCQALVEFGCCIAHSVDDVIGMLPRILLGGSSVCELWSAFFQLELRAMDYGCSRAGAPRGLA
jgi:hypothetical protein